MQYFTGSKEHGIELRKYAIKKGYKLSEYGLFKNEKQIKCFREEDIYKKLGMEYIPPELRENKGEIQAALNKKIPKLISYNDVKGDLQMHTTASDGMNSIKEMAEKAKQLGYEYIAITDHSKGRAIANGLKEDRLLDHIKKIKETKVNGINGFGWN